MIAIEVIMIVIGVVFMIGSFFVTEKLSPSELSHLAKLSEDEIKKIVEHELEAATVDIDNKIDDVINDSMEKVEVALDKETNEKIMAVSEYSDTVLESINKNHNEVMFLYSMLNDKHTELTGLANEVQEKISEIKEKKDQITMPVVEKPVAEPVKKDERQLAQAEAALDEALKSIVEEESSANHNDEILKMYKEGMSVVDIAKKLGLVQGEVKLVIELYKGVEDS